MDASADPEVSPSGLDLDTWAGAFSRGTITRLIKEIKEEDPTIKLISQSPVEMYKSKTKCLPSKEKESGVRGTINNADYKDDSNLTKFINSFVDYIINRMKKEEGVSDTSSFCSTGTKEMELLTDTSVSPSDRYAHRSHYDKKGSRRESNSCSCSNNTFSFVNTNMDNALMPATRETANAESPRQGISNCHADPERNLCVTSPLISLKMDPLPREGDLASAPSSVSGPVAARPQDAMLYLTAQTMAFSEAFRLYVSKDLGPNPKTTGYLTILQLTEIFFEELKCERQICKPKHGSWISYTRQRIQTGVLSLTTAISRPFRHGVLSRRRRSPTPGPWEDCPFYTRNYDKLCNDQPKARQPIPCKKQEVKATEVMKVRDADEDAGHHLTVGLREMNGSASNQHASQKRHEDKSQIRVPISEGRSNGNNTTETHGQAVFSHIPPSEAGGCNLEQLKSEQHKGRSIFGRIRHALSRMRRRGC